MAVDLISHANLNGGSVDVKVYEDTTGDGTADYTQTVSVKDGHDAARLGNLAGGTGNTYWADISASAGSAGSPEVYKTELQTEAGASVPTPTADSYSREVELEWSDTGATGYTIYRAQTSGATKSDYTQVATGVSGTSYSDTGLEDGERYYYRVCEDGGTLSEEITRVTPLPAPSGLSATFGTEDQVDLSWTNNDNNGDGTVEVMRSTDGSTFSSVGSLTPSTSTFTDSNVKDGEKYWYYIKRDTGHATASTPNQSGITVLPAPAPSTSITSNDEHSLSWTDENGEDGVRVYRSDDGGASYTKVADLAPGTDSYTSASFAESAAKKWRLERYTEHSTSKSKTVSVTEGVGVDSRMGGAGRDANARPPAAAEEGHGTAVAISLNGFVVDGNASLSTFDNDGTTGDGSSQYVSYKQSGAATLEYNSTMTRDTSVDWPVKVQQDVVLGIKNLSEVVAFDAQSFADGCSADSQIKAVEEIGGGKVKIRLVTEYKCKDSSVQSVKSKTYVSAVAEQDGGSSSSDAGTVTVESSNVSGSTDSGSWSVDDTGFGGSELSELLYDSIGVGSSCLPANEATTVGLTASTRWAEVSSYDVKLLFDPDVVRIDAVNGTSNFSVDSTSLSIDNTNGVVTFSGSSSGSHWGGITLATIDLTAIGASGTKSEMDVIRSETHLYNPDGNSITPLAYHDGGITVSPGIDVGAESGDYDEVVEVPVSANAGQKVGAADVELSWEKELADYEGISAGDLGTPTVEEESDGTLRFTVDGSATADPVVGYVKFRLRESPLSPSSDKRGKSSFIKFNQSYTTLYDGTDTKIPTDCFNPGRLSITPTIKKQTVSKKKGSAGTLKGSIPQTGVVYWPLKFEYPVEVSPVDTESFEEATVEASSTTNPDIRADVTGVKKYPEDNRLVLNVGVLIPKADPQDYPVKYSLALNLRFDTYMMGGGLFVGTDMQQGKSGGVVKTITLGRSTGPGML